jgi:hypothetical protein
LAICVSELVLPFALNFTVAAALLFVFGLWVVRVRAFIQPPSALSPFFALSTALYWALLLLWLM